MRVKRTGKRCHRMWGVLLALSLCVVSTVRGVHAGESPAVRLADGVIESGRVRFTPAPSGLPAQITIQATPHELPLAARGSKEVDASATKGMGRGPQLAAPVTLVATVDGGEVQATAAEPATPAVKDGAVHTAAKLSAGELALDVACRYLAGGAVSIEVTCGPDGVMVDALALVLTLADPVDVVIPGPPVANEVQTYKPVSFSLPAQEEGVLWANAGAQAPKDGRSLAGVPVPLFAGSGDRGFTILPVEPKTWPVDPARPVAFVEKDKDGRYVLRIRLINRKTTLKAGQKLSLTLLAHPAAAEAVPDRKRLWLDPPVEDLSVPDFTPSAWQKAKRFAAVRADRATLYEGKADLSVLAGPAGGHALSAEQDLMDTIPLRLFRFLAGTHTGLAARLQPNSALLIRPGANPRADRAALGRALLHDIGLDASGLAHLSHAARVVQALERFGCFAADGMTEVVPYWRSRSVLRYGEVFQTDGAFNLSDTDPLAQVYVSALIRYDSDKRRNTRRALFVIVNESDAPVRDQLYITAPKRLFGKTNRLTMGEVTKSYDFSGIPEDSDWEKKSLAGTDRLKTKAVLMDLEDGGVVNRTVYKDSVDVYGPHLHVRPHDFRLLYGSGSGRVP